MKRPRRGATVNPRNRFERLQVEIDGEFEDHNPSTEYLCDDSQTIIAYNDSPDVGFTASLNAYRGCEHGCSYCYARPFHEYLGYSAGLDFETRIMVKMAAPELLRRELSSPRWKPQVLAMSGVTDCYQPVERRLEITRRCLQVLAEFRNPVGIITKNHLVTRDIDHLAELASFQAVRVYLSITTLDSGLARSLEPRAASPRHRLDAIAQLAAAGIPVGVNIAPVIPGLNEHEIPQILAAARQAGATSAGYVLLRLPYGVKDIFSAWLERHLPEAREKILNRVRELRGGALNVSRFGSRMKGEGGMARQLNQLFHVTAAREGFDDKLHTDLSTAHFRPPAGRQLELF